MELLIWRAQTIRNILEIGDCGAGLGYTVVIVYTDVYVKHQTPPPAQFQPQQTPP